MSDKRSDIAKNIWLAGLGAYGSKLNEAVEKVGKGTSKVFDELVEKGKSLETETSERVSKARELSTISIEDRIDRVRHSLGFDGKQDPQIKALTKKVASLEKKLDMLIDRVDPKLKTPTKKRAAKKSTSKKKTARKTRPKKG